jgi:hypothetical protein
LLMSDTLPWCEINLRFLAIQDDANTRRIHDFQIVTNKLDSGTSSVLVLGSQGFIWPTTFVVALAAALEPQAVLQHLPLAALAQVMHHAMQKI